MPEYPYSEEPMVERDVPTYSFSDLAKDAWSMYAEHRRSQKNPFDMNEDEMFEYLSGYAMGGMAKMGRMGRFFKGTKKLAPESMMKARVPKFGDTQEAMSFGRLATKAQVTEAKYLRQEAIRESRAIIKTNPDKAMAKAVEGQFYREMLEEYYKKIGMKYSGD